MRFMESPGLRAPECEVLLGTQSVKAIVRQGQFFKLQTALETGGNDGLFTFARYRTGWRSAATAESPAETAADEMPADAALSAAAKDGAQTADVEMKISPRDEDLLGSCPSWKTNSWLPLIFSFGALAVVTPAFSQTVTCSEQSATGHIEVIGSVPNVNLGRHIIFPSARSRQARWTTTAAAPSIGRSRNFFTTPTLAAT